MNGFYVYVYLDPRNPGVFRYFGKYLFYFEPFYIGKGTKSRCRRHLLDAKNGKKGSSKLHILAEILEEDLEPIIVKIEENLTAYSALKLESVLRDYIGTRVMKNGPLTNVLLRDDIEWSEKLRVKKSTRISGENHPQFGKKRTQEEKTKISKTLSDKANSWTKEERDIWASKRRGVLNGNFGKPMTQDQKDKISVSMKLSPNHPTRVNKIPQETKEKIRVAVSGENNGMYEVRGENHPWWQREHSKETKNVMSEKASNPLVHHRKLKTNIVNRMKEVIKSGLDFNKENFNLFRNNATPLYENINTYLSDEEIQQILSTKE